MSGRDLFDFKSDLFNIADDYDGDENEKGDADEKKAADQNDGVEEVAQKVESNLFLEGDDDDLDDLDDD